MSSAQRFRAVLERDEQVLGWTIARLPFMPQAVWPSMCRLRIAGLITGPAGSFGFRSSLFPFAAESSSVGFFLLVNRSMQQGAGVTLGMSAKFELEADLAPRPAELPPELDALLDEAEGLRAWYADLGEYTRRELGKWIGAVQSDEARLRRAQQVAERLLNTMEAEVELPPAIARCFAAQPGALQGWQQMSATKRRRELLAVFSYQSPEARQRRIGKLLETASLHAKSQEDS